MVGITESYIRHYDRKSEYSLEGGECTVLSVSICCTSVSIRLDAGKKTQENRRDNLI